jgi:hypothetical protein
LGPRGTKATSRPVVPAPGGYGWVGLFLLLPLEA